MPTDDRIKVLYVDDEEGNLTAFKASYRRDFHVFTATSGPQALNLLETEPMHVVISDQRMPGMTGAEFLAEVRARWPKAVRLMLTGYSDIEAVVDAVNKGGIHAYITKPWDPVDLKLRIEQAYEVHALRAEHERLFQRYRQVFDSSGDPIVIVDDEGRTHEANPAAEKLMGTARAELLGMRFTDHIDKPTRLLDAMRERREGQAFTNVDLTLRTPNGRTIDCLMTATYLGASEDGKPLFQAMIKDITDRKQEELRLKKLNSDLDKRVSVRTKQLMEAMEDLGAFSYSVAHDLRSPLKSIKALTEHLSEASAQRGDAEQREVSLRLNNSASRMIKLVDDLLRFARAGEHQIERRPLDLRAVAEECLADLYVEPGRQVEFALPAAGSVTIEADGAMLQIALTNLFSNALKFTRCRERASITLTANHEGENLVMCVKDNGVGFDNARSAQLFGVFKRLHADNEFEGTGIGLAIVQRITQKHGGTCWAEGVPGEGASIFLRFPANAQDQQMRMAG